MPRNRPAAARRAAARKGSHGRQRSIALKRAAGGSGLSSAIYRYGWRSAWWLGIVLGKLLPAAIASLRGLEFGTGSQINAPIAVLIWLMITPMMMKVDFSSVKNVGRRPAGLLVTLFINWMVKPFSMALLAWAFFRFVFAAFITPAEADQYIAGCIILAAAPCTAMVFVWSHLTKGDAAYTLVQVSVNDLIMLVLFVPIVQFLVHGASSLTVPFKCCLPPWLSLSSCRCSPARCCACGWCAATDGHGLKACCCRNSRLSPSRRCWQLWC